MRQEINHSLIKKLPEDHFGKITNEVLELLKRGQCCSVYGLPGYGMEFFAKHIIYLLNKYQPEYNTFLINTEIEQKQKRLVENYLSKLIGKSKFSIDDFSKFSTNNKVALVLGEVLTPNHQELFRFLNCLKWYAKDSFCVLTVANHTMLSEYERYLESGTEDNIFHPRLLIPTFDYSGVERIIELNNKEYNWQINRKYYTYIFELSGGNPALVKYICMAIYEEGEEILFRLDALVKLQPLAKRLKDITDLVLLLTIPQQRKIGLLNEQNKIFSKLVEYCIKNIENAHIHKFLPTLTRTEKKILSLMVEANAKLIDKDQIALILGQDLDTYSEWAIYKSMERLKHKLPPGLTIKTIKGKGWVLLS